MNKTRRKKKNTTTKKHPLFISRWISQIRDGQLFSTKGKRKRVEMSFVPSTAEWNPVSTTLSFLASHPPSLCLSRHDSCRRITSRFLCAIAAVITPPLFHPFHGAFVRSSPPYHPRHTRPFVSFLPFLLRRRRNLIWLAEYLAEHTIFVTGRKGTVDITGNLSTHNAEIRAIPETDLAFRGYIHF